MSVTVEDVANAVPAEDETLWERRMRALTLRNAGATYQRIADQLGVTVPTARKDVRLALREVINETAEDMLARQRSVLMDIQRSNYAAALQGDREAQTMVIRCLEHEAKLFGLYAPTRVAVGVSDTEFAEQAADLISSLGLEPPQELARAVRQATAITVEAVEVDIPEVVKDGVEPTEAQNDADVDDDPEWSNL
jgi:hypothetical protein